MPTYSYKCTACEHAFDAVQSFSDEALKECPECSGRLRKVYTSVGVVFKGSGFYRTDSRSSTSTPSASTAGASSTGSSTSESAPTASSTSSTASVPASTAD